MSNKDGILVSIVIPTYSRNESLKRALDSALNQTYKNIEVLVIDDNPTESEWRKSTESIMLEYREDARVRFIQNAHNMGGGLTRNVGIQNAKGEYIAFLDDDDEYMTDRVEKQLKVFTETNNEKLALVYCFAKFINKDGSSTYSDRRVYRGNCLYEAMQSNCIAATSQWMVKKDFLVNVGCFPDVPCKQDSQTILRLLKAGYEVDVVEEELSIYYAYRIGNKISGAGRKNILGEELYRAECRKMYYMLQDWQILKVEYTFAEKFYYYYYVNKMKDAVHYQWKMMKKLDRKSAYTYRIKQIWHKFHR